MNSDAHWALMTTEWFVGFEKKKEGISFGKMADLPPEKFIPKLIEVVLQGCGLTPYKEIVC